MGSLTADEIRRIQTFADEYRVEVVVIGSRAGGTATQSSDFDYLIGGNSKIRRAARQVLPRGQSGGEFDVSGDETGIDIFNAAMTPLDTRKPHVIFKPNLRTDEDD